MSRLPDVNSLQASPTGSPLPSEWSQSLQNLLKSSTGQNLFLEYLRDQESQPGNETGTCSSSALLFLLAVEGLHQVSDETTGDHCSKLLQSSINLIYKRLLPSIILILPKVVTHTIRTKISKFTEATIYDEALEVVVQFLQRKHSAFLNSPTFQEAVNFASRTQNEHSIPNNNQITPCDDEPSTSFQSQSRNSHSVLPENRVNRCHVGEQSSRIPSQISHKISLQARVFNDAPVNNTTDEMNVNCANPISRNPGLSIIEFASELQEKLKIETHIPYEKRVYKCLQPYKYKYHLSSVSMSPELEVSTSEEMPPSHPHEPEVLVDNFDSMSQDIGVYLDSDQEILDQHVRRIWRDSPPEFRHVSHNKTAVADSRTERRWNFCAATPSQTNAEAASLQKGPSLLTLDSGIRSDLSSCMCGSTTLSSKQGRRSQKQFVDFGYIDSEVSAGDIRTGRPSSTTSSRAKSGYAESQLPQRQSTPSSNVSTTVNVLVHYDDHEKPFSIKIRRTKLTLGYLKSKLPKKGDFKYLVQLTDSDDFTKRINYELRSDDESLPMSRDDLIIIILKTIHPLPQRTS